MFKRTITNTITDRLKEKRNFIQIILGPRQVGKSTAIRQAIEELGDPSVYALADLPVPPDHRFVAQYWDCSGLYRRSGILRSQGELSARLFYSWYF